MMGATEITWILSICFSGGRGNVSVQTTVSMTEFFKRSMAGPENTPWVVTARIRLAPLAARRSAAATMVPPVSIMSSITTQVRPRDLAHDLLRFDLIPLAGRTPLVHDGQIGVELVRVSLGDLHPAGVRGHDDQIVLIQILQIVDEHGHGGEVIDRAVEEALDLSGVQVDRDHALGAGGEEQVGHQASGDRLAARGLAVLTGVAVERRHHGDPLGRGPLGRVDHDQLLHDRVVDRVILPSGVGLDDEHVAASDRLGVLDVYLAVGELVDGGGTDANAELVTNVLGQLLGGPARHHVELLVGL